MFVRFRQSRRRLQCSLLETRRVDGKVRHEHIASLGTIEIPPSIADRAAFWGALLQRLGKLSNRLSHQTHGKLFEQIKVKIPIPTKRLISPAFSFCNGRCSSTQVNDRTPVEHAHSDETGRSG